MDLNFIFVLNYLAIDMDYHREETKAIKKAQQKRKII